MGINLINLINRKANLVNLLYNQSFTSNAPRVSFSSVENVTTPAPNIVSPMLRVNGMFVLVIRAS